MILFYQVVKVLFKNKVIVILTIIVALIAVSSCIFLVINRHDNLTDAIKFKNEYMSLNDKMDKDSNKVYVNVNISDNNTIKYISDEEAVKLLQTGTGLIYFGTSTSIPCRLLVPILTDLAYQKKETVYYLDIAKIRSIYNISTEEITKIQDGSKNYYKILKLLDNYLQEYDLSNELKNIYNSFDKRLLMPTLVMVNNGEITGFYEGNEISTNEKLTKEEKEKLESIINDLIDSKEDVISCTMEKC